MTEIPRYQTIFPLVLYFLADLCTPFLLLFCTHFFLIDTQWGESYTWLGGLSGLFVVLGMSLLKGYSRYADRTISQKLELVFKVWIVAVLLLVFLAFLNLVVQEYSRKVVLIWSVITPFFLISNRLVINHLSSSVSKEITVFLLKNYEFTKLERERLEKQGVNVSVIEDFDSVEDLAEAFSPHLIVLNKDSDDSSIIKALTYLELRGVRLLTMEHFMEVFLRKCFVDYTTKDLAYLQEVYAYTGLNYFLKRLIDIVGGGGLAVITLPIAAYSIIKIRKESPGSPFFVQKRVGQGGRLFNLYKFRSMHENSYFDPYTQKEDVRIFPYGHVMRKMRIDELPQLWNVLKGDMHILGPRSEWDILVNNYEKDIPFYQERHLVKPGISGWAQVMYPYGTNLEDTRQKLMYDLYYIKNWSIWLELETILKTVFVVFGKKGL